MSRRARVAAGSLVTLIGVGAIAAGWLTDDEGYVSSLLLEVGAAVLLVVPLIVFERLFERRVQQAEVRAAEDVAGVRDQVETVQTGLDAARRSMGELQAEMRQRMAATREADRDAAEVARQDVSFDNVHALFARAAKLNAISQHGLRIPIRGHRERVRFRIGATEGAEGRDARVIMLSVEDPSGNPIDVNAIWTPTGSAVDVLAELAARWQAAGTYPGDAAIDPDFVFAGLIDALELVIRGRRDREQDTQLHALIEPISRYWVATDFGLEHLTEPPYWIQASEIVEREEQLRLHLQQKTWVRAEDEDVEADDFFMTMQRAKLLFAGIEQRAASS